MTQGVLPFKYEEEKKDTGMTGLAGLPVYLDLAFVMGLSEMIGNHLHVKQRGWTDAQMVLSLILLNIAGGDCVEDLRVVEKDEGFCKVMRRAEQKGKTRRERREEDRRWRKDRRRSVPSPSAAFRYLSKFHDSEQDKLREEGKAFIPLSNEHLRGLVNVNRDMVDFIQKRNPQKVATLDQDATLVATAKFDALYNYKGFKSYQPINTWWAEHEVVLHTEFRDGNVPAGYEQLRVFEESLALLPEGVEIVRLRSDTAGYQHNLLRYCEKGENERFGRIEFAVAADVTPEFKKCVLTEVKEEAWKPIYKEHYGVRMETNQQWTDVCFIPSAIAHSKNAPRYQYIAIREAIGSMDLPELTLPQQEFPFQTLKMNLQNYKLFGLVTNMKGVGEALIHWHRGRCGKSEEAHAVMKSDFAGGKLPSGDFGENAAWWWIMILAMNLHTAMKRLVLGTSWASRRMKAIRFSFINIPGRIVERSHELIIRLVKGHPAMELYLEARRRIREMCPAFG
ncbi:MAG: IS1380 family transposase [Deltaproteobacteria bacterium]